MRSISFTLFLIICIIFFIDFCFKFTNYSFKVEINIFYF